MRSKLERKKRASLGASRNLLTEDWDEIYYALDGKALALEGGIYDSMPREVDFPASETRRWVNHLRRIMAKIGER
jgi:hypothetical protein